MAILKMGVAGTVITAVCCVMPVLVTSLGAVGLSAWAGWLGIVLFPGLAPFLCVTVFGLWRRRSRQRAQ